MHHRPRRDLAINLLSSKSAADSIDENDPSHPSWPPFYKANHHLSFRPIILLPKTAGTASGQTASSQPGDADYLGPQRVDPSTLRPITMQAAAPFGPNRGGRAELTGSMQNKERSATGQYIPTGPGPGMPGRAGTARSSVAPSAVAATPTPIPTQRPLAGRADSQRRDSTPLRAVSVVDMGGAVITPKAEPGEAGVPGPSMLTEAPPSLSVQGSERDTCGLMTAASHGSEPYGGTGFAGQADAGSSDFSTAPPRKKGGRPLGSGKPKQRFVFESEDALRSGITEQDLASNPIGTSYPIVPYIPPACHPSINGWYLANATRLQLMISRANSNLRSNRGRHARNHQTDQETSHKRSRRPAFAR
jgi:hypothetical protein